MVTKTITGKVYDSRVIEQEDLLTAINHELARIGEKPVEWLFSLSINLRSPVWGAECHIDGSWQQADVTCEKYPDHYLGTLTVQISWSSTGRSVAEAAVAIKNYQRALDLAAFIKALTAGKYIAVEK